MERSKQVANKAQTSKSIQSLFEPLEKAYISGGNSFFSTARAPVPHLHHHRGAFGKGEKTKANKWKRFWLAFLVELRRRNETWRKVDHRSFFATFPAASTNRRDAKRESSKGVELANVWPPFQAFHLSLGS